MRPVAGTITDPAVDKLLVGRDSVVDAIGPQTFDSYQAATDETAIYPRVYTEAQVREIIAVYLSDLGTVDELLDRFETPFNRLVYPVLGLVGEAAEIANKLKKVARDDQGKMDMDKSVEIQAELGDVMWYVARVATELKTPLERICYANLRKLFGRKARGVLGGDGDNR